jgi:hypothetical protein
MTGLWIAMQAGSNRGQTIRPGSLLMQYDSGRVQAAGEYQARLFRFKWG